MPTAIKHNFPTVWILFKKKQWSWKIFVVYFKKSILKVVTLKTPYNMDIFWREHIISRPQISRNNWLKRFCFPPLVNLIWLLRILKRIHKSNNKILLYEELNSLTNLNSASNLTLSKLCPKICLLIKKEKKNQCYEKVGKIHRHSILEFFSCTRELRNLKFK